MATPGEVTGEGQTVEKEALGEGDRRMEEGADFFFLLNKPMVASV